MPRLLNPLRAHGHRKPRGPRHGDRRRCHHVLRDLVRAIQCRTRGRRGTPEQTRGLDHRAFGTIGSSAPTRAAPRAARPAPGGADRAHGQGAGQSHLHVWHSPATPRRCGDGRLSSLLSTGPTSLIAGWSPRQVRPPRSIPGSGPNSTAAFFRAPHACRGHTCAIESGARARATRDQGPTPTTQRSKAQMRVGFLRSLESLQDAPAA